MKITFQASASVLPAKISSALPPPRSTHRLSQPFEQRQRRQRTRDPAAAIALDTHGHDPAAYGWVSVLKKRRKDGWSPGKQRAFIEALADCGSVATAAQSVGMSESSAYRLRRSPGAEAFDRAWGAAIEAASKKLIDAAFERALVGTDEPVFDREGHRVGRRFRQSDRLLMFLLRVYGPDCFRAAAAPTPVAEALAYLHPAAPAEPAALMAPDDLADALEIADLCDGELPHWYRDDADDAFATFPSDPEIGPPQG